MSIFSIEKENFFRIFSKFFPKSYSENFPNFQEKKRKGKTKRERRKINSFILEENSKRTCA